MGLRIQQVSKTLVVGTAGTDRLALDQSAGLSNTVRILNTHATAIVYVAFGDATVTADLATAHPILANSFQDFDPPPNATHMAFDSAAGAVTVITTEGLANP